MPNIRIIKTDPRDIDYIKVSLEFTIDGGRHIDYEEQGPFRGLISDGLNAGGGTLDPTGKVWVGNFLYSKGSDQGARPSVIQIDKEEGRAINGMRVSVDFQLGGAQHADFEDVGNFDRDIQLSLNGLNGSWTGSRFEGNFLRFDTGADFSAAAVSGSLSEDGSRQLGVRLARALQSAYGLNNAQAAGVVGNLYHESAGMNSNINEFGHGPVFGPPNDNEFGYGWVQWSYDRKGQFLDNARAFALDPSSTLANWRMLERELTERYNTVIVPLQKEQSPDAAAVSFMNTFEMPENPQQESRIGFARMIFGLL